MSKVRKIQQRPGAPSGTPGGRKMPKSPPTRVTAPSNAVRRAPRGKGR